MGTPLGRFRHGATVTPVRTRTVDAGGSTKTKVATFSGQHFVAEREGDQLCIYAVGDSGGLPGTEVLTPHTGDRGPEPWPEGPAGIKQLNAFHAALNAKRKAEAAL